MSYSRSTKSYRRKELKIRIEESEWWPVPEPAKRETFDYIIEVTKRESRRIKKTFKEFDEIWEFILSKKEKKGT